MSVLPLYVDKDGTPEMFGSAFFVQRESSNLLVSAAHVLDRLKAEHGYYYVEPGVKRKITGRLTTSAHQGPRDTDKLDLGAVVLEGPRQPPYPSVQKVQLRGSLLHMPPHVSASAHYGLVGFPASRSRTRRAPNQVIVEPYAYLGASAPFESYTKLGLDPDVHVCLKFDRKKSYDLDGNGRSFPMPHGLSGSPIFFLYDDATDDQLDSFALAGVVTTWERRSGLIYGAGARAVHELIRVAA